MEEPDEVIHYLQVRGPAVTWTTVASGSVEEVERELREWHRRAAENEADDADARLVRVERFYGPIIRLGATIRTAGEQGERRETHPSKPT